MICPDCGEQMVKADIECEDMSGWYVAWICGCIPGNSQLVIWAKDDWTSGIISEVVNE